VEPVAEESAHAMTFSVVHAAITTSAPTATLGETIALTLDNARPSVNQGIKTEIPGGELILIRIAHLHPMLDTRLPNAAMLILTETQGAPAMRSK
jgi:hypothetical protein